MLSSSNLNAWKVTKSARPVQFGCSSVNSAGRSELLDDLGLNGISPCGARPYTYLEKELAIFSILAG